MVLDLCPEFYVGGKENLLWQPENEETQRRRWLAPKEAPKPVSVKVPQAVPATTGAPAASAWSVNSARRRLPTRMLSASAQDLNFPGPMQPLAVSQASAKFQTVNPKLSLRHCGPKFWNRSAKNLEHGATQSRNLAFWNRTHKNPATMYADT